MYLGRNIPLTLVCCLIWMTSVRKIFQRARTQCRKSSNLDRNEVSAEKIERSWDCVQAELPKKITKAVRAESQNSCQVFASFPHKQSFKRTIILNSQSIQNIFFNLWQALQWWSGFISHMLWSKACLQSTYHIPYTIYHSRHVNHVRRHFKSFFILS